jgi:hypothetical protein
LLLNLRRLTHHKLIKWETALLVIVVEVVAEEEALIPAFLHHLQALILAFLLHLQALILAFLHLIKIQDFLLQIIVVVVVVAVVVVVVCLVLAVEEDPLHHLLLAPCLDSLVTTLTLSYTSLQ